LYVSLFLFHKPYIFLGAGASMIEGDEELCIGCRTCEIVCSLALFNESCPEKSAIRISESQEGFEIIVCNQCDECEKVCPEGAIYIEDSVVKINETRCTGCYVCVDACPRGALFIHPDVIEPIKCTHCTQCVEACPVNALYVLDIEQ
jgi:carbon-monoxide dehydrogenase iron sulfur subunit